MEVQRRFPVLGTHLAEIELPDDDPDIAVNKAPDDPLDSHYSLRGEPESFLRRLREVFPCDSGRA